jgi:hypothetical protein
MYPVHRRRVMLDVAGVNWLAVVASRVVSYALGGLWYAVLFTKPWIRYTGITHESAAAGGNAKMAASYAGAFAMYLVAVAVLALLLEAAGAAGVGAGLLFGLLVGVGIVATVSFNNYLFSMRPVGLYLIDIGYPIVALAIAGVILGLWQ